MINEKTLESTTEYSCAFNDLIDSLSQKIKITVYTLKNREKDGPATTGISLNDYGIYDIVITNIFCLEWILKKSENNNLLKFLI